MSKALCQCHYCPFALVSYVTSVDLTSSGTDEPQTLGLHFPMCVFMCPYRPHYPSRAQPSCLSTSVCQTRTALAEVTGGAVPVISAQRCVNICHEAHVHCGDSCHMDVTAAIKTENGAGLSLLYWASCLSSSALIRDDGPRPPPPSLVYR